MKILSWNIQAGIATTRYAHYITRAYRQLLNTPSKLKSLRQIAEIIADYDVVCLQEVDLGGRRAGFTSQADILAAISGHTFHEVQENRVVRNISRHGNAIFSKYPLQISDDMKLPGKIGGRGALIARVEHANAFTIANTHLSLGRIDQALQMSAVSEALPENGRWVLCGDLNMTATSDALTAFKTRHEISGPDEAPLSYPSWAPRQALDHILCGAAISMSSYAAVDVIKSDHLPLEADIDVSR